MSFVKEDAKPQNLPRGRFKTEEELLQYYEQKAQDIGDDDEDFTDRNIVRELEEEYNVGSNRKSMPNPKKQKKKQNLNDSRCNDFEGFEDYFE